MGEEKKGNKFKGNDKDDRKRWVVPGSNRRRSLSV